MYVPDCYRVTDSTLTRKLISTNPLALLVSGGADNLFATHVPVIPRDNDAGELVGSTMVGHMNRMNPHWPTLITQDRALLIFQGPHGYVSPTVYRVSPAAPTWNFTAAHLRGTISRIDNRTETLRVVTRTVEVFERKLGNNWDMRSSLGYFDQMLPGIGAFRFQVESAETMFKLSQEQPLQVRRRVVHAFAESDFGSHQALASLMDEVAFENTHS